MTRTFFIQRADARLACTEVGSGPLVVLLHAGGERRGVWTPVAARLAAAGLRSVAVDQRGHGESSGSSDALAEFVDDACALLERLEVPVVLVGASLGGFVALLAGERAAESGQVAGVVLVDVVPDPPGELSRAYLRSLESGDRKWNWSLIEDALAQAPALRDAAARSPVPIALVRGERGGVRDEDCARLQSLVPSLVVRKVDGAGHLVAKDRPEQLAEVLLDLLESLPLPGWREP
jgi:pimeloyl-ACP methyl ester carboxylesterase